MVKWNVIFILSMTSSATHKFITWKQLSYEVQIFLGNLLQISMGIMCPVSDYYPATTVTVEFDCRKR